MDLPPEIFTEAAAARARMARELGPPAGAGGSDAAAAGANMIVYGPEEVVPYGMVAEATALMAAGRACVLPAHVKVSIAPAWQHS